MAKNGGGNGGGASVMLSSEEHNARRRAAKKRPRRGGRIPMNAGSDSLFGMIVESGKRQAKATKERFRLEQAICAIELVPGLLNPQLNEFEREEAAKVAVLMINKFIETEAIPEEYTRTDWAEALMHYKLTAEQRGMPRLIKAGVWAARAALPQAYDKLTSDRRDGKTATIVV